MSNCGESIVLWHSADLEPKTVVVRMLSGAEWFIEDYCELSDGTDLFRTRKAAIKNIRNMSSKSTRVPYLRIVTAA